MVVVGILIPDPGLGLVAVVTSQPLHLLHLSFFLVFVLGGLRLVGGGAPGRSRWLLFDSFLSPK